MEEVIVMIDWFFDELPYWIYKIEGYLWVLVIHFIKYLVEGVYAIGIELKKLIDKLITKAK